jgi:micrococcal nuclease
MLDFMLSCLYRSRLAVVVMCLSLSHPSAIAANEIDHTLPGPLRAEVLRVLDGDSMRVRVQIWLGQNIETTVRIEGLDTAELRGRCERERDLAYAAKNRLAELVGHEPIMLYNIRSDKYGGRVIADVFTTSNLPVAKNLIAENLGRPYAGGKRQSWCTAARANPANKLMATTTKPANTRPLGRI